MTRHTFLSLFSAALLLVSCHSSRSLQDTGTSTGSLPDPSLTPVVRPRPAPPKRPAPSRPQDPDCRRMAQRLDNLMGDPWLETSQLGLYVFDLTANAPVFEKGARQRMRPASTMKIVTATVALAQLGTEYQYATHLYIDGTQQGNTLKGNLYVKAGFDPLLGYNDLNAFADILAAKGIRRIQGKLILDTSIKDGKEFGWGWCWDDDNPSLSPLLYNGKPDFSPNFLQALSRKGITLTGNTAEGRVPSSAQAVAVCQRPIADVLRPMMKQSDNLDAESMFYQIAAQTGVPGAGRRQASECIRLFINGQLALPADNYLIADGSGLSLYNYVTPELLVGMLRYAYAHPDIYRSLLSSLPVAGRDGTLKNRLHNTAAQGNIAAKTGTVTGICSLAGYATAANGHRLCFAIINQGQAKASQARLFQDKVCRLMTE